MAQTHVHIGIGPPNDAQIGTSGVRANLHLFPAVEAHLRVVAWGSISVVFRV